MFPVWYVGVGSILRTPSCLDIGHYPLGGNKMKNGVKLSFATAALSIPLLLSLPQYAYAQTAPPRVTLISGQSLSTSSSQSFAQILHWNAASPRLSGSNIIIVDRNAIANATRPARLTKTHRQVADKQALDAITNTPYAQALRTALQNGAYIVFTGNKDGLLNDALVDEVLGIPTNKVPEQSSGQNTFAIGVWGPNGSAPHFNAMHFKTTPTMGELRTASQHFYEEYISGPNAATNSTISPMGSSTTSQTGWKQTTYSDNYYEFTNTYYLNDTATSSIIGDMVMDEQIERVAQGNNEHKWDVSAGLTSHTYYSLWQMNAIYQGFTVTNWSSTEGIVYVPNTSTIGTHTTTTGVSVSLSDPAPTPGFQTSWGYTLPDIVQTFNGQGQDTAGWNYSFAPNTGSSENGNSFDPGLSINNSQGWFLVELDNVLSMEVYQNSNVDTTGDQYYTISVPDWGN